LSPSYRLFGYFRSSAAFRVRIALNLKGLKVDHVSVNLPAGLQHQDGFRSLSPQALVPLLETAGGDRLVQSMAIIEYLDEMHPKPAFLPADPLGRAFVRGLAQMIACEIHPLNNLRVLNKLRELGQNEDGITAWYHHWLQAGLGPVETRLVAANAGTFCAGESPGLADIFLVPQVTNAERYRFDLGPYPTIRRIVAACRALPAFAEAAPEKQPDAA
jgi:maleylpyruvate isomerase